MSSVSSPRGDAGGVGEAKRRMTFQTNFQGNCRLLLCRFQLCTGGLRDISVLEGIETNLRSTLSQPNNFSLYTVFVLWMWAFKENIFVIYCFVAKY